MSGKWDLYMKVSAGDEITRGAEAVYRNDFVITEYFELKEIVWSKF